jgi:hypothetical protein
MSKTKKLVANKRFLKRLGETRKGKFVQVKDFAKRYGLA